MGDAASLGKAEMGQGRVEDRSGVRRTVWH